MRVADNYIHEFIPNNDRAADSSNGEEILGHDGGIPIFRMRSAEETEVAHDLLELSRSLPPLPPPGQVSAVPLSSMHEHQVESSDDTQQQHLDVSHFSLYYSFSKLFKFEWGTFASARSISGCHIWTLLK